MQRRLKYHLLAILNMSPWSLISPASRGIGFALAKRVLQTTNAPVVVTARKDLDKTKEDLLNGINIAESRLTVLKLDVLGTKSNTLPASKNTNQSC